MSPLGIAGTVFNLISSVGGSSSASTSSNTTKVSRDSSSSADFASSLALRMASSHAGSANAVNVLTNLAAGKGGTSTMTDFLSAAGLSDPISFPSLNGKHGGLSASGRNAALFDPESAFRMMTDINNRDVNYKAQFSELSEMKTEVADLQKTGLALGNVGSAESNDAIKAHLQKFVDKYNEWVARFDGTVKDGGVLEGTQAAEVSLNEMRASIENRFNGAAHGLHGLRDIGIDIDPTTHLASLDTTKLDAVLAQRKDGVIAAIDQFGDNFAKSAELLGSANNFIPNRLANLDRVIHYISDNKSSLQAEFGLGDAAKPAGQIARALAAYNQMLKA